MQKKNIRLVLFDLDGVLINSKSNMKFSWNKVKKKFKLKQNFDEYFKFIGLPFENILAKINITKNVANIEKEYKKNSISYFNKIKLYKNVKNTLISLKNKNIKIGIVTSKDKSRTIRIIKKLKVNFFNIIVSPQKKLRGKPFPDQINQAIKRLNAKKIETIYVGDMFVDYLSAKNAEIDFIFANYGYGKNHNLYKKKLLNISDLKKIVI